MSLPPHDPLLNARRVGYTRSGFGARYHAHRPRPPAALVDVLLQLAGTRRPRLVVDLGSGTGISTTIWAPHAERVIGIEPLDEMRKIAAAGAALANVSFQSGVAQRTGVPDGAADIVTCAQSLHHVEPVGTLAEIGRILRIGGVLAAYDYDWPPVVRPAANHAFAAFIDGIQALQTKHGNRGEQEQWAKDEHVERIRASRLFRHVSELALHNVERCTAERWVGFARTIGFVLPGREGLPWYVSYRVRVGVK
jgi:SAM-dependent methyltransferase